jgi:DNA polymerase V
VYLALPFIGLRIWGKLVERVIALIDANNFFVSCERLFQPSLIGKPVIVLSSNDGCAISRSNEVKKLDIPMGAPYFKYKEICESNSVKIFSSNFELYGDISSRLMTTIASSISEIEVYSIDEAFVDLTGVPDPYTFCEKLREKILQWVGIPVSIGIGNTKTIAKVAGEFAKKDQSGVYHLQNTIDIDLALKSLVVSEVWGIGSRLSDKLGHRFNIRSAYDLKIANAKIVRKYFSVMLERTIYELNGFSCLDLEEVNSKKSIAATRTFGKPVFKYKELREAIATFTASAARRLRKQNSKTHLMYVYIRTSQFKDTSQYVIGKTIELVYPTADTGKLIDAAINGLKMIYKKGYEYKKAGIILLNIFPEDHIQQDLLHVFDKDAEAKSRRLMKAIDNINYKYNKIVAHHAVEGFKKEWKVKSEFTSQRYTTRWGEIPIVN